MWYELGLTKKSGHPMLDIQPRIDSYEEEIIKKDKKNNRANKLSISVAVNFLIC